MSAEYQTLSDIKTKIVASKGLDFFAVADMHLQNLKNRNKHHQYDTELGRIKKFKEFLGNDSLQFNRLNVNLLRKFETHLLHTKQLSPRTIVNYLILIRTIFNLAISESITDRGLYPFGKGKITIRIPESQKIGFTPEEIQRVEMAKGITDAQQKAIHIWLVSFYFAGIRVGDVLKLKWSDLNDGRLLYRMNKNSKLVSLKIPEKVIKIFNIYNAESGYNDLIFPQLKGINLKDKEAVSKRTQSITRNLNRRITILDASIRGIYSNSNFLDENLRFSNFPLRTRQASGN